MSKYPWKVDDPAYPDYLQYEFVGYIFRNLFSFTDDEVIEFTGFYRLVWKINENHKIKQARRLELILTLTAIKNQKVIDEKRLLQQQIDVLNQL